MVYVKGHNRNDVKDWKKSEIYGSAKWYHRERGDTLELWQRGNTIFTVYLSKFGSLSKNTLGEFKSRKKAFEFMIKYMRSH